jgi:hypothetical protein
LTQYFQAPVFRFLKSTNHPIYKGIMQNIEREDELRERVADATAELERVRKTQDLGRIRLAHERLAQVYQEWLLASPCGARSRVLAPERAGQSNSPG